MTENDRPDYSGYITWLKDKQLTLEDIQLYRNHYGQVALTIQQSFLTSPFWQALGTQLPEFNSNYYQANEYQLLSGEAVLPDLLRKPFDSFFLKTYRKNILNNPRWPDPPDGGWIVPPNWFEPIKDIVRTSLIVKYLDGVQYLADQITTLAHEHSMQCQVDLEAREEGYYAAHLSLWQQVEIPGIKWDSINVRVALEIQITTQVQDLIRKLLHKYYEEHRAAVLDPLVKWQWDYRSSGVRHELPRSHPSLCRRHDHGNTGGEP